MRNFIYNACIIYSNSIPDQIVIEFMQHAACVAHELPYTGQVRSLSGRSEADKDAVDLKNMT